MKNLLAIPYPRKSLGSYFGIVIFIGLAVNFILMVFQPFGTATFNHPHKMWILAGYGVSIALAGITYYLMSFYLFKRNGEKDWNIVAEVVDLFLCSFLCIVATYFYFNLVFGLSIDPRSLVNFLGIAGSVALFPILLSLLYLYSTWKDVISSRIDQPVSTSDQPSDVITLITGQNKTDKVETKLSDLICAKAQDNYVMLFIRNDQKIQKHLIRSTLKKIYDQLDQDAFIQTHRSHLVNRYLIRGLTGNKSKAAVVIADFDKNVPVSRSMYDQVKSHVNS